MDPNGAIILAHLQQCLLVLIVSLPTAVPGRSSAFLPKLQTVHVSAPGHVSSAHFPERCCVKQRMLLIHEDAQPGYIHLTFSDLDLPPGTTLKIYSKKNGANSSLFLDQPRYEYDVWRRPFISTSTSPAVIYMVLNAGLDRRNYGNVSYAGFRAHYQVTQSPRPAFPKTRELCKPLVSPWEGSSIRIKPQPAPRFTGLWLDCLWVIKPIPQMDNADDGVKILSYIRFDEAELGPTGSLEVRQGRSSLAPIIVTGQSLSELKGGRQPFGGFVGSKGFYVRVILPAHDRQNRVFFSFGVVFHMSPVSMSQCPGGGFQCPSLLSWCLPQNHVCNHANNCPAGEDEALCDQHAAATTQMTRAKPSQCGAGQRFCQKGQYCTDVYRSICPDECASYEKRCTHNNRCVSKQELCPWSECAPYMTRRCIDNSKCYTELDQCDGYTDCIDASDERDCPRWSNNNHMMSMLIALPAGVVVFGICCVILCYKCCNGCKKYAATNNEVLSDVGMSTGLSLHRLPTGRHLHQSRSGSGSRHHGYLGVSTSDCPETSTAPAVIQEPPPSYEEVTSSNVYPIINLVPESPPPPYESVMSNV